MSFEEVIIEIKKEMEHAERKHGPLPVGLMLRVLIVAEEIGEVFKAVVDFMLGRGERTSIDEEMIQVAATAIRFLMVGR